MAPSSQNQQLGTEIKYQNKFYLNHLIHVAKNSPLAVLELGVSSEVISLLREVTVEQKNNAMRFKLPLFQWRFSTLSLPALPPSLSLVRSSTNTDLESNTDGKLQSKTTAESGSGPRSRAKLGANSDDESVSEIDWIHYLIRSSPLALDQLPKLSALGTTYRSETVYPLAEHLVRFKMRSTIITTLIPNLHNAKMREMYHRILGTSSSCGKLPSATGWYFLTERRRAHSSFYLLLYRLAYDAGLPHIHSIIASYSWYTMLAGADPLPIDRMGVLVNGVQSGSGMMYIAACRKCKGNYLLSNTDEKKEFSHDYHCEACKRRSPLAA